MSNVTEVIKTLSLDLTGIPDDQREEAKRRAGNYLLNEILRNVGNGTSPVEGEGKFKILDKKYAKVNHKGRRLAKLELDGDLLAALKVRDLGGDTLEVGVRGGEAPKADGHNQLSQEAKNWAASKEDPFPKRRFIPDVTQNFKSSITEGINRILDRYKVEDVLEFDTLEEANDAFENITREVGTISGATETPDSVSVEINDIFSDEVIEGLLLNELRKNGRL